MNGLDKALFHHINGWPDGLEPVMVFLSKGIDQTPVRIVLGALLVWLLWRPVTRVGGLVAGLGWVLANEATDMWKLIPFARPGNVEPDAIVRIGLSQSNGTASAHSANMAFLAYAFAYYFGWKGSPAVAIALGVGLSRIYVGAHYPSQVLLGWTTGVAVAAVVIFIVEKIRSRNTPTANDDAPELD
jgi:undecaprenyl-diphosphatase